MEVKSLAGIAIVAISLSLAGCDLSKEAAIEEGKGMIASSLKDPDSAKFRDVFMIEDKMIGDAHYGVLCGEVNSKNSFGGFTGFHRFVANFHYSKQGQIGVSYFTLEEGTNAKTSSSGNSYFEDFYWAEKCVARPTAATAAVATSEASTPPATPKPKEEKPVKRESAPVAKVRKVQTDQSWTIQIASMSDASKAESIRAELAGAGLPTYSALKDGVSRVFVGPYLTKSEAEAARSDIATQHMLKGFVVRK